MQTVSLETALKLRDLGVDQTLNTGDRYHLVRFGGAPAPDKERLKLPRLDQIMDEIRKRLPGCLIKFAEKPQGIHCWVEAAQSWPQPWHGLGPTDTEACGLVLVQIMEAKP